MRVFVKLGVLALLLLFAVSCSDNIFGDDKKDDSSDSSKEYALEMALNDRDYQYILGKLDSPVLDVAYLNSLTLREKYLLQMSHMGAAQFNLLDNVDKLVGDNEDAAADILLSAQGGGDVTIQDLDHRINLYDRVKQISDNSTVTDDDIDFAVGLSSSMNMMLSLSKIVASLNGGHMSFDKNDPSYYKNVLDGKTALELQTEIDALGQDFIDNIVTNSGAVLNAMELITGDNGKDFKKKMDEFLVDTQDSSGATTSASLADFILKSFSGN